MKKVLKTKWKAMRIYFILYFLSLSTICFSQTEIIPISNTIGEVSYESKDHRSNVYEVVSDRKVVSSNQYQGVILAATDYYPYGSEMGGRSFSGNYKYGFQGQEKDNEVKGLSNTINYKYRVHDPRVGRFFAVDPLVNKYPHYSSYQFSGNRLIDRIEYLGMEADSTQAYYASRAVYGGVDEKFHSPTEWNKSTLKTEIMPFVDLNSGFKSQLYEREREDGTIEYMLSFAGTEASIADIGNDIDQLYGKSTQYYQAARLADELAIMVGYENITFTGHSLGGGLAAISSMVTGSDAITFNAAGVSEPTELSISKKFGVPLEEIRKNENNITAYVIDGEILDKKQRKLGLKANGNIKYFKAKSFFQSSTSRHSISNFNFFTPNIPLMMVSPEERGINTNPTIEPITDYSGGAGTGAKTIYIPKN